MTKRIFALLLCFLMLLPCLAACSAENEDITLEDVLMMEEEYKGAEITVYLSELIYDLDPANAYNNESALKIISMLYEPMFYLTNKGKIESNIVERYEIIENEEAKEYKMSIYLAETFWSDNTYLSANDVVYSWKRILDVENSYPAAALLFDIKNARAAREGDVSIDSIGLSAPGERLVEIVFEGKIDYDQFLLNLTSYALAPIRENYATKMSQDVSDPTIRKSNDWAKRAATMASSGPFKLRTVVNPSDPVKGEDGNYLLNENGEFLYPYQGIGLQSDGSSTGKVVDLTRGAYSYVGVNEAGEEVLYVCDGATYSSITDSALKEKLVRCEGLITDFATTPQNGSQLILERNSYYFRDPKVDLEDWVYDTTVKPYRLIVDFSMSDEEIMAAYEDGTIYYVGDIPLSVRADYKDKATITDALSTHSYFLNQEALIKYNYIEYDASGLPILYDKSGTQYIFNKNLIPQYRVVNEQGATVPVRYDEEFIEETDENGNVVQYLVYYADKEQQIKVYSNANRSPILGENILANEDLRLALSLAIDRDTIASQIVFAEAASALVPTGVLEAGNLKKTFREMGESVIATTANVAAAQEKLAASGVDISKFTLNLSYARYDEVHTLIAEAVAAAWQAIGVNVKLNPLMYTQNVDIWLSTGEQNLDTKDDLWLETIVSGDYEIMAMDMVAYTADPFSVLAPFATLFSGMGMNMRNFSESGEQLYIPSPHVTGFSDETYDAKIEEIFALKNSADRAALLHEAEKYLLSKMPVIPIVYNQNATMTNAQMLTDTEGNYYTPVGFKDCYLKDTEQYDEHVKKIVVTTVVSVAVVLVVAGVTTLVIVTRIKAKKREEEIARISAEQEAKLREIRRPGSSRT